MQPLLELIRPGTTVVTATRRLGRSLVDEYDRGQAAAGAGCWDRADVLPWGSWLQRLWGQLQCEPGAGVTYLLTPSQEAVLWERIIADAEAGRADAILLPTAAVARTAREAWGLVHAWHLPAPRDWPSGGGDVAAFAAWARRYETLCRDRGWIDEARLPDWLGTHLERNRDPLPERLVVAGYDESTPQHEALFERLRALGCEVVVPAAREPAAPAACRACPDSETELQSAAAWAREHALGGARVAVVVPDLTARRAQVERVFGDTLAPAALLPDGDAGSLPFNLSAGRPLAAVPVVHAALGLLGLNPAGNDLDAVGELLRSPFLGGAGAESNARALLDARLRERAGPTLGLAALLREARRGACPNLAARLEAWRNRTPAPAGGTLAAGEWAEVFGRVLSLFGWPGERVPDSAEYQALEAWRRLLAAFAATELVRPPMGRGAARALLQRMAADTVFQPEAPPAAVQVLGLLEAAGHRFDALWVTGLHDEAWPVPARPNPMLPLALQRERGLPHGTAEREHAFAGTVLRRLRGSAGEVVLSYPLREGDVALRPSPLLGPEVRPFGAGNGAGSDYRESVRASGRLEALADGRAPPVPVPTEWGGGARLFQLQAACPFRAFAALRLGAAALGEPAGGLDAAERGNLVHKALEHLWRGLGGREALDREDSAELDDRIDAAAAAAVTALEGRRLEPLGERFRAVERARLRRILHEWLAVERARGGFQVASVEGRARTELAGVSVDLRVDRIDRLEDGRLVVIDYKTGQPATGAWFGDRPEEPQLPLYATCLGVKVAAVAFAQVRPGDCRFRGFGDTGGGLPGIEVLGAEPAVPDPWATQLEAWRTVLEALAAAFRDGDARVDPKNIRDTCRYCDLPPLCRVHEQVQGPGAMSREEAGDD